MLIAEKTRLKKAMKIKRLLCLTFLSGQAKSNPHLLRLYGLKP